MLSIRIIINWGYNIWYLWTSIHLKTFYGSCTTWIRDTFRTLFWSIGVHAEKKSLRCKNCDQEFEKESYLDTHSSFIHKHLCNFCDKKFTAKSHLHKHIKYRHKNGSKPMVTQKLDKTLNGTPKVLNLTEITWVKKIERILWFH